MIKKLLTITAITTCSFCTLALAEAPSYSFVGVGYSSVSGDGVDIDGYELFGSFELNDKVFLEAEYANGDAEGGGLEVDVTGWSAGIGYILTESDTTNTYVSIQSTHLEVGPIDGDGYGVAAGVRSNVSDEIQLSAQLSYTDIEDSSSTTVSVGAEWFIDPNWSLGLGLSNNEGDTGWQLGATYYY